MQIEFTEKDLSSGTIVEPGWYVIKIDDVEDKQSKGGDSVNSWLKGHIIKNADTGDEKYKDIETPFLWIINSKAAFGAIGILSAIGVEPKVGMKLDTSALKNRVLEAFIGNEVYEGKMQNKMMGMYRAFRG